MVDNYQESHLIKRPSGFLKLVCAAVYPEYIVVRSKHTFNLLRHTRTRARAHTHHVVPMFSFYVYGYIRSAMGQR